MSCLSQKLGTASGPVTSSCLFSLKRSATHLGLYSPMVGILYLHISTPLSLSPLLTGCTLYCSQDGTPYYYQYRYYYFYPYYYYYFYTVPVMLIVKIVSPIVCALTFLSIALKCYCRRLKRNRTKHNQEFDNKAERKLEVNDRELPIAWYKEIDYKLTRCPEKNPQGDMV